MIVHGPHGQRSSTEAGASPDDIRLALGLAPLSLNQCGKESFSIGVLPLSNVWCMASFDFCQAYFLAFLWTSTTKNQGQWLKILVGGQFNQTSKVKGSNFEVHWPVYLVVPLGRKRQWSYLHTRHYLQRPLQQMGMRSPRLACCYRNAVTQQSITWSLTTLYMPL